MRTVSALSSSAPIGVFDSGLGGLTVVRQLQAALPNERIVYVADQAHVPYGGRELTQVCGFACGISEALLHFGCKAIVMACNISSATGLKHVQAAHPNIPVLGVIEPGAKAAVAVTQNGRVGVLATEGTVRSGAYTRGLHTLNAELQVTEIACPDFVPLVEAGQVNTLVAEEAARRYLAPLQAAQADTIVLGCTHYPFLLPVLNRLAPGITFIDPALATCRELAALLDAHGLNAPPNTPAHLLTTTGDADTFACQLTRFLPNSADAATAAAAHWQNDLLHLPDTE